MQSINTIQGLRFHRELSPSQKAIIKSLEEPKNIGVHQCLKKKHVLVLSHDHTFRDPLFTNHDGSFYFGPQPFPEYKENAIMASPSAKVHHFLIESCKLILKKDEATLLVGFD